MARFSYTAKQNERIRAAAQQLRERMGSQERLAEQLEITQPALSAFLRGLYGASQRLAEQIAQLSGRPLDEILGDSKPKESVDRYANRAAVVRTAQQLGFSRDAVDRLRKIKLVQRHEDAPAIWWMGRLVDIERRLSDTIQTE